jgi:hypothetical protein
MAKDGCLFCSRPLAHTLVDLGMSPLCESYVTADGLAGMEPFYPLHVKVCDGCLLAQLPELVTPEHIFTEYAYFSSFSSAWLRHAEDYAAMAAERLGLGRESFVVELASNDGYLLQYFVKRGIPSLGIEPAANVAEGGGREGRRHAGALLRRELAAELAGQGRQADLVIGNNVLAQVPDLNSFVPASPAS